MNMSDNKQNRRSFTGKGYYIALILCAAAIGISGYLYYRNENQVQQVSAPQEEIFPQATETEDLPVVFPEPAPQETEPETVPETAETSEVTEGPKVLKTAMPVEGAQAAPYSVEALAYNETTRDWRTHNGVDLAADSGTEVKASAAGKVYTTYDDDSLGATVVIRHDGGYTTRYSSLREDLQVSAGDTVELGQPIGYVGTTALIESDLGPHVHFSVSHQDVPMDPAEFFALG